MKHSKWAVIMGGAVLAVGAMPQARAANSIVVDDFGGGPHAVFLASSLPPEIKEGTFHYGGAAGGVRDVFIISTTAGLFNAGVTSGSVGFDSFVGLGQGGIIWDGVAGAVDKNNDGAITVASDFDFGLNLDLIQNSPAPLFHLTAAASDPGASVLITVANSAMEFALYRVPLTKGVAFDDYQMSVFSPTFATGGYDATKARAIALTFDGFSNPNQEMRVSAFKITGVPESGTWIAVTGLGCMTGGVWCERRWGRRTKPAV